MGIANIENNDSEESYLAEKENIWNIFVRVDTFERRWEKMPIKLLNICLIFSAMD